MNRLTKKCMIASAGMHGLLILVLLLGSAFANKKVEPMPEIIELVNFKVTDGKTSGGGNPTVQEPPPPEPEPPAPKPPEPEPPQPEPVKPEPVVVKQPDPPKIVEPVKIKEPDPIPVVAKAPTKPKVELKPVDKTPTKPTPAKEQPKLQLKPTVRKPTQTKPQPTKPDNSSRLAALADSRRSFSSTLRDKTSKSTSVETPGPGGEAYVNYRHLVTAIYERAYDRGLMKAGEIGDRDDSVDVSVVIGNSGRVISARITRNSGNPALNKLVKGVLDSVDSVPGFPEGTRDTQRTFNITFDLKSRRLTG